MSEFDEMRLRRLDATLLLVFLALIRTGKAAEVAAEMGMTPSAISHALGRLRDVLGDPLFLRRPHGLEPTAVALAVAPRIEAALEHLQAALAGPPPLDPATFRGTLRLSALDYEVATLLPGLVARAGETLPGLRVAVRSAARSEAMGALGANRLDLALGFFPAPAAGLIGEPLYEEGYAVAGRAGHPALCDMSVERYAAARHAVVSPRGDLGGIVDGALARLGLSREVAVAVPQFLPALALVAASDLLVTVPARLGPLARSMGLRTAPPPLALRPFTVTALRHVRDARSPLLDWVVGAVREAEAAG